jgi:hypothetical protein
MKIIPVQLRRSAARRNPGRASTALAAAHRRRTFGRFSGRRTFGRFTPSRRTSDSSRRAVARWSNLAQLSCDVLLIARCRVPKRVDRKMLCPCCR